MVIDEKILDDLTEQAKASPRLRMNYDLRTTAEDKSQRMLNAIEPGTEVPVHRHRNTNETVICVRGRLRQCMYDDSGKIIEEIEMVPGGAIASIPAGVWHNVISLESGTVLFEAKDGAYAPFSPEDIMQ